MKVQDVMQRDVVTLGADDSLDIADDIMMLGRIRHLPVVDKDFRLVGLVTQRDLLKASVASVLQLGRATEHQWLSSVPVQIVMSRHLFTVTPTAELGAAVDLMVREKIGCLPVVDEGRLVGVLTETDCLGALRSMLLGEGASRNAH